MSPKVLDESPTIWVLGHQTLTLSLNLDPEVEGEPSILPTLLGKPLRPDTIPKSRKLTELEESAFVQYILDLDSRIFLPYICDIEDIANKLLADSNASPVGKR